VLCLQVNSEKLDFVNFAEDTVEMFWIDDEEHLVAQMEPYEHMEVDTEEGHSFYYILKGNRYEVEVTEDTEVHVMGTDTVKVVCSTSTGDMHISVKPHWSPFGAARFLQLIEMGYYNGCALNRVVKGFLTQFGISSDFDLRTEYRESTIRDDEDFGIEFHPGFMSFAGSGENSRTAEVFVVMPDTPLEQLAYFGDENPWETPFGFVEPESLETVGTWYEYGDMPPWGKGPDPQKIYESDGYEYLKEEFPEMSYIDKCNIVAWINEDEPGEVAPDGEDEVDEPGEKSEDGDDDEEEEEEL